MSEKVDWLRANTNLDELTIEASRLYDDGVPAMEIAKMYGLSRSGVYGRINRAERRWLERRTSRHIYQRESALQLT